MKYRFLSHKVWPVLFGVLFAATVAIASVPPVITITAAQGDVTFTHRDHQVRTKGQCVQCHHEGAGVHSCRSCHDGKKVRVAKEVVHVMCRGCHNEHGNAASPLTCEGCHQ